MSTKPDVLHRLVRKVRSTEKVAELLMLPGVPIKQILLSSKDMRLLLTLLKKVRSH